MNAKTTWFKNVTDQGNVAKMYVEVIDTPNSTAGKAHCQVGTVRRGDDDSKKVARRGNYHPTREAAEAEAAKFIAQFAADANLKQI